jgi:chromosome partitioning protein
VTTIALINQKGGVGKTTSTMNLGAGLSMLGKSVLLVDLDPQAHLTYGLGIEAHELDCTVYEVLRGEVTAQEAILKRDQLEVLPSSLSLSAAEMELSGTAGREFLLKEALEGLPPRDFVLLDCPPSLGLLTLNALTAAQEVFIPLQTEFLALQGMSKLMDTINVVRKRLNPGLTISGIIGTQFDSRKNLNKEVVDKIREYFSDKVFSTLIHDNVALAEAPSYGQTIFEYRPTCRGAQDYLALCREAVARR